MNWEIVGIILLITMGTVLALYLLARAVVALKLWWKSLTPTPTVITTPPPGGAGPATGSATSSPTTTPTSLLKWGTIPPSATPALLLVFLWLLTLATLYCLHPGWCVRVVTEHLNVVLGVHAAFLALSIAWYKKGGTAGRWALSIILICVVAGSLFGDVIKVPEFKRPATQTVKQEPPQRETILTSSFNLKEGEYEGPIILPSGNDAWKIRFRAWRKIYVRIEDESGTIKWGSEMSPDGPVVKIPQPKKTDQIYVTSLDGEQEIFVSFVAPS